jgi:hypothetical protein
MKIFRFRLVAQLVAGVALTVIVSPPASANFGCPGGGRGPGSPSIAPPPTKPPVPPSTFTPWKPGVPGNVPPPPPKTGLTAAEKENLKAYKFALQQQHAANLAKSDEFKKKNSELNKKIAGLESQMREAETVRPKEYSRLELQLIAAKQEITANTNASREYWNRSQENQRKINDIERRLAK